MKVNHRLMALVSIAALASALVACGGSDSGSASASTVTPSPTSAGNGGGEVGEPTREVEVLMYDNYFEPTEIRLAVGEAVNIVAKNEGAAMHNMHILSAASEGKDFTSAPLVNPGETSEFVVQFNTAGTFKFQCDLHLPGMVGEVIVE